MTYPILLITSTGSTNPFGSYYTEILRNEGFNAFQTDISTVSSTTLSSYDIVILAEMTLSISQVTMLSDWVNGGGRLIVMRPDPQLNYLLGLIGPFGVLDGAYLLVDTSRAPGKGIVNQTIQYKGIADTYVPTSTNIATLYSDAVTQTNYPAVTMRKAGSGIAACFTYDLARSIVYMRQGNPAWVYQERDGFPPERSDDLFYPDWIDFNKVTIPQADEQQRLLANMILEMTRDIKPIPRFWYLPRGIRAAVVMTGDDHAGQYNGITNATQVRFDRYLTLSQSNCSVDNWECIRSTSYIYTDSALTDAQALAYQDLGFEISAHVYADTVYGGCGNNYTLDQLETFFAAQLNSWKSKYTSITSPRTHRIHCIAWSGWTVAPTVELNHGIRFDTNYYYWPGSWILDRPGFFTGSGMPMRFCDLNGNLIDVYQATTQMTDESNQTYPLTCDSLFDKAIGPEQYFGVFTVQAHNDANPNLVAEAIITSALARGIPIVSSSQMLDWIDGRNNSTYSNVSWNGTTLSFSVTSATTKKLQVMVPATSSTGIAISTVNINGNPTNYVIYMINGINYAFITTVYGSATYDVAYALDSTLPTVTGTDPASGAMLVKISANITATFSKSLDYSTVNSNAFELHEGNATGPLVAANITYNDYVTITATLRPMQNLVYGATYTAILKGGPTGIKDISGNAFAADYTWSFTTIHLVEPLGWYTGDMHVHRSCGSSPINILDMFQKMIPQNLSFISLLADMGDGEVQDPVQDLPRVTGVDDPVSIAGRIVHWDAEWHWDPVGVSYPQKAIGGHVVALGLTNAHQIWSEYTFPIFQWAHQQNAYAGFAHIQYLPDNLPQTLYCCIPIEYPVEIALGTCDFIDEDVVDGTSHVYDPPMNPEFGMHAYYRLLNCGFRPGLAAGTDFPCNGVSNIVDLGALLTYAKVAGTQVVYRNWVDSIISGRTVVSRNGHNEFLDMTVNNTAVPGDQVNLTGSGSVTVTVVWTANQPLTGTIELVNNGEVVASKQASVSQGVPVSLYATVTFIKSGWLVARRMDANNGHQLHTAAVFIIINNAPVRANAADAQFFVQWMDNLLQKTSPGGAWNSFFINSLSQVQSRYQSAKVVYQQIAIDAGPPVYPCKIWYSSATPGTIDTDDLSAVELGVKFRSDINGYVTGIRFYKALSNTGTHIGSIWSNTGTLLGQATFTVETTNGWQQASFIIPIAVTANTTYVVSYHTDVGHYSSDNNYFTSAVDTAPLHALQNGIDGPNGVYIHSDTPAFPTQTWNSSNYWVDVVFQAAACNPLSCNMQLN
jgi:hypothetical protein